MGVVTQYIMEVNKVEPPAENAVQEFLDGIPKEGEMPKEEEATPVDSSTTNEDEKKAPVVTENKIDDNTPFHKHPRWKQLQEEKRQQADKIATYEQRFAELESKITQREQAKIPEWFSTRFGEDQTSWDAYKQTSQSEKSDLKKEIMAELKAETQQETKRQADLNDWVQDNLNSLEDEGEKFDKNALLKVLNDYAPSDANGNIDFKKGLAILRQFEASKAVETKEKSTARKEVASATTSSSKGEKQSGPIPAKQLRKLSFLDLVRS